MRIGVPTEIKNHEYRVGLAPAAARELVHHGHEVLVQAGAGLGIGAADADYAAAGAKLLPDAAAVFAKAEMIVKVKEPQLAECRMLKPGQVLFTYLHLAPDPEQAEALMASGCTAIAYETVTAAGGSLPLLAPMSEVAGRMSIQAGAHHLEKAQGGRGVLLGGTPGVQPGKVVILGGGVAGTNAAHVAVGVGADVTILEKSLARIRHLDEVFNGRVRTVYSTVDAVETLVSTADLVIGSVLIPGASAPKLITRALLKKMLPGSVVVDIAIDQGGCLETSRATTHDAPTFVEEGVIHYCVANMPGAVARTSTMALNNATLPYALALADKGWKTALADDAGLKDGLNVHAGKITFKAVAEALRREADYRAADACLA
ncbi:alanine dehydrogenase [Oleispirillum naphthae]|uniref:alanine dehydrogenase n=1 Tax=Oleispirillum naphthae TaxID=2838853 RepID=UPI00308229AB